MTERQREDGKDQQSQSSLREKERERKREKGKNLSAVGFSGKFGFCDPKK